MQKAVLICLESSFWYSHQNIGFRPAFEQATKIFARSDAKKRVEQDISKLIEPRAPITEQKKVALLNIILRNRLGKLYHHEHVDYVTHLLS